MHVFSEIVEADLSQITPEKLPGRWLESLKEYVFSTWLLSKFGTLGKWNNIYEVVAQVVNNRPAMRQTWVWSLGWEKPLEKGEATHSSILA